MLKNIKKLPRVQNLKVTYPSIDDFISASQKDDPKERPCLSDFCKNLGAEIQAQKRKALSITQSIWEKGDSNQSLASNDESKLKQNFS